MAHKIYLAPFNHKNLIGFLHHVIINLYISCVTKYNKKFKIYVKVLKS